MEKPERILKQKVEASEQEARVMFDEFLEQERDAIRALRSFCQILDGGFRFDDAQLDQLKNLIEERSSGKLKWTNGLLCQIGNNWQIFQHECGGERMDWIKRVRAVRGFWFHFQVNGCHFECVDLDAGRSREYFDSMTREQKSAFIGRFANRDRGSGDFLGNPKYLPLAFTAFITDNSQGYFIEEMVPYRHFGRGTYVLEPIIVVMK